MTLDYVKIFDRPLRAEEIKLEYNTMGAGNVQISENGTVYAKSLKQY